MPASGNPSKRPAHPCRSRPIMSNAADKAINTEPGGVEKADWPSPGQGAPSEAFSEANRREIHRTRRVRKGRPAAARSGRPIGGVQRSEPPRDKKNGGGGWIRTSVRRSGQIYSLLDLTTLPPLHDTQRAEPKAAPQPARRRPEPCAAPILGKSGVYSEAVRAPQPFCRAILVVVP